MNSTFFHTSWLAVLLCVLLPALSLADTSTPDEASQPMEKEAELPPLDGRRFSIGVGFSYVRFDTNFKITDKSSGQSIFIDAEGSLGLPEADAVGVVFGYYRFARRHGLGFSAFSIRRETTLSQDQVSLGQLTFTGEAELTDRSSFYFLSYNYTFFEDDRSRVYGSFGLYGLDLDYRFEATGSITIGDEPIPDESIEEEAVLFAPLPMFGLDMWFSFNRRWSVGTKISLVAGRYKDITAGVLDTTIRTRVQFTKHVGMAMGVTYFSARVKIDDQAEKSEIQYGFNGAFLGLALSY